MRRLYLRDMANYMVRTETGHETLCRWSDVQRAFLNGRGAQARVVPIETLAAVKRVAHTGLPRCWYPLDQCYRAIHEPRVPGPVYVNPIRARALGLAS